MLCFTMKQINYSVLVLVDKKKKSNRSMLDDKICTTATAKMIRIHFYEAFFLLIR